MFICINDNEDRHTIGKTAQKAFAKMQDLSDGFFADLDFYETTGKVEMMLVLVPKPPAKK